MGVIPVAEVKAKRHLMHKTFPRLYAQSSTGKTKWWEISVSTAKEGAEIYVRYGYEGQEEEKIQSTTRKVREGKNLGHSNETTPFEQACSEAESTWQKKKDKKYSESLDKKSKLLLPMLAHDFKKRGHNIEFPAFVQPKLNGVRCLAKKVSEEEVQFISRGGKNFETLKHIEEALLPIMNVGSVFDGELFTQRMTFQQIVSAVKRQQEDTSKIEYWIYDCILEETPFEERSQILAQVYTNNRDVFDGNPFRLVPTDPVSDKEEFLKRHEGFVQVGYEGTILRNRRGLYRCDFRSPDLQKYKDFLDSEYLIVGGKDGTGRAEGTIIWTCITEDGKEFDVRPQGTEEQRREWWKDRKRFVGEKLTVRYQNLSDDGIPIFPVGISMRGGTTNQDGNFEPDL